jgi:hypothetical protein
MAQSKEKAEAEVQMDSSVSQIRSAAKILEMLYEKLPNARHREQAENALEASVMWATKAIEG